MGAMSWEPHMSLPPLSLCHPGDTIFVQKSFAHLFSSSWAGKLLSWERGG